MPKNKKYKKYKRCVRKVKAKNSRVRSPHAVCRVAVYGKKKVKHKTIKNPKGFKVTDIDKTKRGVTILYKKR